MKKIIMMFLFLTGIAGANAQERVSFNQKFQKANQGRYRVEIPPLKELLHIMLAITDTGLENDDMVNQKGTYYQDVLTHFKPFANEPIIKTFDSLLQVSLYNYIFISGNAMSYDLSGNKMVPNASYIFPASGVANVKIDVNPLTTYKKDIEAFAKKSSFRKFYSRHKPYYDQVISSYETGANLGKQWTWLEKNFKNKINSYLILCSPLINSLNYTTEFQDNGFHQIVMVLPLLENEPERSVLQNEIFNTRVMFTEIDHNYINLPSGVHQPLIDSVFKERKKWVNEKADGIYAYPTPTKVFNEYMTWGVFLLYCADHYDHKAYQETRSELISVMKERGFIKMDVFLSGLEKTKSEMPDQKIDDLYPRLLEILNH